MLNGKSTAVVLPANNRENTLRSTVAEPSDDNSSRALACLAALVAIAAILRLLGLSTHSFWLDEGVSYAIASAKITVFDSFWAYQALYHELLRAWIRSGLSDSEFSLRLLSVVPSVATIPVVYQIGQRLFSRRVGLLSSLLLAVHVAHITYSQQARGYGLAVFFVAVATYFFIRAVQQNALLDWISYVLFSTLAIYSHFLAVLVIPAHFLAIAALPSRAAPWKRGILSAIAVGVLSLPLAFLIVHGGTDGTGFISAASYRQVPAVIAMLGGHGLTLPLYLLFWIMAGGFVARTYLDRGRSLQLWSLTLLVSWMIVPVGLLLLISLFKPAFVPRYLLICAPAAVLLGGVGLSELKPRTRAWCAAALVLLSCGTLVSYQIRPREDWRGAARYVVSQARPGDAILVLPPYSQLPFKYYRHRFGGEAIPLVSADKQMPASLDSDHLARYQRLWVVTYTRDMSNPAITLYSAILARDFRFESDLRFTHLDVKLYSPASTSR